MRLHPNVSYFSCVPKSRCLHFLVCIYINFGSFFSCASSSKFLFLLGCACIKMFAISRVRLNQDVYVFSCASTSIFACTYMCASMNFVRFFSCAPIFLCSLFFVCIYINFACTCERLHEFWFPFLLCAFIRIVASTRVRLHRKMVPISRARLHKKIFAFSPVYIKMVPFSRVRLH